MTSNTIAKNTTLMTGASIMQKIISFVYFTLVARTLGVEATGQYTFALAFTTIFVIFVDLGFNQVLIREGSKKNEQIQTLCSAILFAKIFLGMASYMAVLASVYFLGYSKDIIALVAISGVTMLFDSFHLTLYGILRSLGNLKFEAFGIIMSQGITLLFGTFFLYQNYPLPFLMVAFLIPSSINVIFASFILIKKFKIYPKPVFHKTILLQSIKMMIPFALSAVLARIYSYADTILLSKIAGDSAVGFYSVPYKITYAFQFIPLALIAALYPKASEYFAHDKARLGTVFSQAMNYLLIIVIPIAIGIAVLAPYIIPFIYTTAYLPSVSPLQILMIGLIFSFLSFPVGALLNACNQQHIQTRIIAVTLFINIVINLILIPRYQGLGAAIAALTGNIFLLICGYIFLHKYVELPSYLKTNYKLILSVTFSGLCMGAGVWYAVQYLSFLLAIPIGGGIYLLMLLITKTLSYSTIKNFWHSLFSKV